MKYYAQRIDCSILRKIIADSDEEAFNKAVELFGTENVIVGKSLQKIRSREEQKEIYKSSEEMAGRLFGPVGKIALEIIHSV